MNDGAAEMELPKGWSWAGLPGLDVEHTYDVVPLERLPRLRSESIRDWAWVPKVAKPLDWSIADPDRAEAFLQAASAVAVAVPESFRSFIAEPRLRWAIRSGTGCWWSLGEGRGVAARALIANALGFEIEGELPVPMAYVPALDRHLVRFLTDRQDCLFWFLTLGDEGGPILVSGSDLTEEPPEEVDDISMVAPTFEEFIYRFWIENEIAFRTIDGDPLTDAQQAYLSEALRLAASTTEGLGRPPNPPPGSGDIRKHSLTRASCNLAPWPITRLT